MNLHERTQAPTTYKSSITLDNIIFHIRAYQPSIATEAPLHQNDHCHFSMEIQYIYSGNLKITSCADGKVYDLKAGDFCIIPGELYHSADADESFQRMTFNWHIEKSPLYDEAYSKEYEILQKVYNSIADIKVINDPLLTQIMEQYRIIANDQKRIEAVERKTVFLNIIIRMMSVMLTEIPKNALNEVKERESTEKSSRKWIIEEHIAGQYMNSDGISGLAKKLYLSERQTRALILKTFGKNYKDMIVEQRMEVANLMIANPLLSLEEISRQVGYKSYSGFYIAYTKYHGISPEEKRRAVKEFEESNNLK